jgi:hypothetical protein
MCDREVYNGKQRFVPEQILKKPRGSDCSLEFGSMKAEWLVIANNWVAVNVAEVRYTSPVVPRELSGLKSELITLANRPFSTFL